MHDRPSDERRGWNARRPRRLRDRIRHELRWRIPAVQSSERGRLLLELLRHKHLRHHTDPHADRHRHAVFNGRNVIGWLLTVAGALFILAGVIANMHIYFQPTTLFNTLVMLVLLVGGLGLIARAIRPHPAGAGER